MKLSRWLRERWQAALRDLFGEGDEAEPGRAPGAAQPDRLADLLREGQLRLDDLHAQARDALARRKRIELAWLDAEAEMRRLDAAVDAALTAGDEPQARRWLAQQAQGQAHVQELAALQQACAQVVDELNATIAAMQAQLAGARRQREALEARAQATDALEALTQAQRQQASRAAEIQLQLSRRQEQIAQAEDRLAARREVSAQVRKRTEESSWP